jgi:hypothetical protein
VTGRRALLLAALVLGAAPAAAQTSQPAAQRPRPPNRPRAQRIPPPPPAPPAQAGARPGDPAPVPNRDLEGPRGADRPSARLDPALIDPNEPRPGATAQREGLQAREDRLLRNPAPGARLRVPFSY